MKVGIVTHYYLSPNYGGNLQAYALCKVLSKMGYEAEQISLDRTIEKGIINEIKKPLRKLKYYKDILIRQNLKKRQRAVNTFNREAIPHSRVYSEKTIVEAGDCYDAYITGSDQVWHPNACCDAYLLNFVSSKKIKLSYAASIACESLPDNKVDWYQSSLKTYKAISVREKEAIELLRSIAPVTIEHTLDPTLLLGESDWNEIIEPCEIGSPYIFSFFLGSLEENRKLVRRFACEKKLKIVALPHLMGHLRKSDIDFGDYQLYDVSPGKLLSLIKNATCVFTDSFHAAVFSSIFKKEFFVLQRDAGSMNSRIYNLLSLFDADDHFFDAKNDTTLNRIYNTQPIQYSNCLVRLEKAKIASMNFLKKNLSYEN